MQKINTEATKELVSLLRRYGELDYIGEPVSQLEHSLQCAELAASSGADSQTVVAALLHDIGHFLPPEKAEALHGQTIQHMQSSIGGCTSEPIDHSNSGTVGRVGHEAIGECFLRSLGFQKKVCALVGSHVAAKRYLTATEPSYYDALSDASKRSLELQGGPMNGDEIQAWASNPWCEEMCQLRKWDDLAKVVGKRVPDVDAYVDRMDQCLRL